MYQTFTTKSILLLEFICYQLDQMIMLWIIIHDEDIINFVLFTNCKPISFEELHVLLEDLLISNSINNYVVDK